MNGSRIVTGQTQNLYLGLGHLYGSCRDHYNCMLPHEFPLEEMKS